MNILKVYLMCDVSRISGILGGGNGLPPWYWFPELEKDDLRGLAYKNSLHNKCR